MKTNLFLLLLSLFSCAEKSGDYQVKEWISEHAVPITTVQPSSGFDDLEPIKDMVGDARIVSLGEPTHGNREVFQLKHRMIEFLVEEMGFNNFILECPFAEAYDINRYILEGIGDPKKALAGIYFWTWDTEEFLALIEWMRTYNADPSHETKVKFYGMDVQDPERAARVMLDYLKKVDPKLEESVRPELGILEVQFSEPVSLGRRPYIPEEYDETSLLEIKRVMNAFQQNKQAYISVTSETEWSWAKKHTRQVEIWIEACINDGENYAEIRDKEQAENIKWVLDQQGDSSKAIVWAHNCHVSNAAPKDDVPMHGYYLRKMYGDQLKIFGLFFNQGGFKAIDAHMPSRGMTDFFVGKVPDNTLEHTLSSSQHAIAVLDLNELPEKGPIHQWFNTLRPTRHSGGGYNENKPEDYFWSYVPAEAYNILVYIDSTTPTKSINDAAYEYIWMLDKKLETPTNLDFESGYPGDAPEGWMVWSKFQRLDVEFSVNDINPYKGKQSAMIHRPDGIAYGEITPSLTQRINASHYRGKTIKIKAACRSLVKAPGFAFFRLTVDPGVLESAHHGMPPIFDSLDSVRIETSDWNVYEIEAKVPEEASSITYGIYLRDSGTVWIDTVSIEVIE
ncbi:erythromycin esterase family protein [Flavobacteriaceae bacterium D16]|nr:erythromycin esterase family protein [Flavobacteriaceae bacterium D16]